MAIFLMKLLAILTFVFKARPPRTRVVNLERFQQVIFSYSCPGFLPVLSSFWKSGSSTHPDLYSLFQNILCFQILLTHAMLRCVTVTQASSQKKKYSRLISLHCRWAIPKSSEQRKVFLQLGTFLPTLSSVFMVATPWQRRSMSPNMSKKKMIGRKKTNNNFDFSGPNLVKTCTKIAGKISRPRKICSAQAVRERSTIYHKIYSFWRWTCTRESPMFTLMCHLIPR